MPKRVAATTRSAPRSRASGPPTPTRLVAWASGPARFSTQVPSRSRSKNVPLPRMSRLLRPALQCSMSMPSLSSSRCWPPGSPHTWATRSANYTMPWRRGTNCCSKGPRPPSSISTMAPIHTSRRRIPPRVGRASAPVLDLATSTALWVLPRPTQLAWARVRSPQNSSTNSARSWSTLDANSARLLAVVVGRAGSIASCFVRPCDSTR